jgi:hypothetical protein
MSPRTKPWDPSMVSDPVQERLLDIIASKKTGKRPARAKPAPERPSNVASEEKHRKADSASIRRRMIHGAVFPPSAVLKARHPRSIRNKARLTRSNNHK